MHECDRVYRDKLIDEKDMENYDRIQADITKKVFEVCAFLPRNLFQQQSLPWLQGYFYMVQKKGRMEANEPSVTTYRSTEHMRSRPELAISYKSLYFSNLSLECVLRLQECGKVHCRFKQTQNSCANRKYCYEIGNANFILYCEPRSAKL